MTPQEFKAWFDGFTEAFSGTPTKAQWARVKERVAEIDGRAVTERIYLDRYWPALYPPAVYPYQPHRYWTTNGVGVSTCSAGSAVGSNAVLSANSSFDMPEVKSFNSTDAMFALGRADAQGLPS